METSQSSKLKPRNKRIEFIQYFRGIAILLVILTHTTHHAFKDNIGIKPIDMFIWFGHQGVTLFFVISAFTIFYSIDSKLSTENNSYDKFMVRRFFRIAPLYYLGILFYKVFTFHNYSFDINLILNLLFINWLSPTAIDSVVPGGWSITTEFTFYFFAPILFGLLTNIGKSVTAFLILVVVSRLAVSILVKVYPTADSVYYLLNPLSYFPVFIVGIVLYFIIIKNEVISLKKLDCYLIAFIILLDFILGEGTVIRVHYLDAILFALLVYAASKSTISLYISKPLSFIGELSFTIYITHFLVINLLLKTGLPFVVNNIFVNWVQRFGIVLIGAVIISWPIYHLIEKPLILVGKIVTTRPSR